MSTLLSGVRVVEYAQYVAGPFAGSLLAELGAEVIKVEPPGGDAYRQVMAVAPGVGRYFVPLNRGKRSVVLDLKTAVGLERSRELVSTADIVLHNLRPDRAARFGLDWESLHALSPRVVAGVVTSFGPEGPLAGAPAYDLVAQARSGLLTAHASPGDVVPVRAGGVPLADLAAGFLLATGVLAALVHARETGVGERVEVPLLAAAFAVQVQDVVWLEGEQADEVARPASRADLRARADEIGLGLATNPYYRCYEASTGFLAVACLNLAQRRAFIDLFGLEDLTIEAPDLIPDDAGVVAAKRAVTSEIAARIATEPVDAWLSRLEAALVPCGPVLGAMTMLGRLFHVGDGENAPVGAAPVLGADTASVIAELDAR